ncbi:MAG: rod shape-determining protein [Candidatus Omnitrophica bacterium]|nr:rod shape-determining protein [Candidatus Omnitrophota bacterium]
MPKSTPLFIFYIGSTKLSAVKVKQIDESFFDVVEFHEIQPSGFEKGNVVDGEKAVHDIRRLSSELGSFSEFMKYPLYLVIESAFSNTYSLSSSLYFQKQKRIYSSDVNEVIDQTREVATLPMNEHLILSVAQGFIVNDLSGIRNPVGLDGTRLGVDLLLGTLSVDVYKKLQQVFKQNGLRITNIIPKGVAGTFGLLGPEEFKGSTLFLDVGGKLTSLVYIRDERVRRSSWLTFGGENWTQRVVQSLGMTEKEARRVKEVFGSVQSEREFHDEIIPRSGGVVTQTTRDMKLKDLYPLLNDGMKDFLELIRLEIDRIEKVETAIERIVITGGGARMDGFLERLQDELKKPVRLAQPLRIRTKENHLIRPEYASFLGTLRFLSEENKKEAERYQGEGAIASAIKKAKDWFHEYF